MFKTIQLKQIMWTLTKIKTEGRQLMLLPLLLQQLYGWFHVNEGQPCHPYSQILITFCSNVPTYKKQKWAKFFHLTLNGSWDISFWNLDNFRAFFSEIHHFKFSIFNKIVITWVLWGQSSWKLAPLYFFGWGIQKSH